MRLRAPAPDDAPAVAAIVAEREQAELGAPEFTVDTLLDDWRNPSVTLAEDACIVEHDDGRFAAYAIVLRHGAMVVVAAEFEGRGIGARLLRWAEERERAQGRPTHRQWIAERNTSARALLLSAGYRKVRSYARMTRRLDRLQAAPASPAGVRLRELSAQRDAAAMHALDAAAFAGAPDYGELTLEQFRVEHVGAHDMDASLSCVAEREDGIVGFALTRRWPARSVGFLDILAVHPDHQGRGTGGALLAETFRRIAAAGLDHVELGVSSENPRALRLYERFGMTARYRFDTYERRV